MTQHTRKKILFLITKSNWGGAQRYVYDLATNLNPNEFEIIVALGGTGRLTEELVKKGVRVISLNTLERDISLIREIKTALELWNTMKSEKPDILHINSSKAGGLGALIGRLCFVQKIIFTAHGWAFNEERPTWQKFIIKILHGITILLSHHTIVVSKTTKQQMNFPFAHSKMHVVHNGRTIKDLYSREFSRSFFSGYVPTLRDHENDFWSVTIGELHPIKQHDVTIRALASLSKQLPNIRHLIIGEGEERKRLESLVQELDLEGVVFFTGNIPEASQYLKAFDLFVLSSRSEALAYVIIEACIAGLPIIASNVGGIPEIITHKNSGLLFPSGSVTALATSYTDINTDPTLRETLAQNALLRAQDFTFEKMLQKTITLYKE
ncbi:MAG: glycosyltransferase family 4 protein [Candidatus Pacebacteria bacterium]|nr:glycosyltransferase family 4 protein [Candidatus Paceibacterota bacterium]MCF7856901.1 glycosyltransferase family 4 protein [Candidatus Paceibacterota bacterium]